METRGGGYASSGSTSSRNCYPEPQKRERVVITTMRSGHKAGRRRYYVVVSCVFLGGVRGKNASGKARGAKTARTSPRPARRLFDSVIFKQSHGRGPDPSIPFLVERKDGPRQSGTAFFDTTSAGALLVVSHSHP